MTETKIVRTTAKTLAILGAFIRIFCIIVIVAVDVKSCCKKDSDTAIKKGSEIVYYQPKPFSYDVEKAGNYSNLISYEHAVQLIRECPLHIQSKAMRNHYKSHTSMMELQTI